MAEISFSMSATSVSWLPSRMALYHEIARFKRFKSYCNTINVISIFYKIISKTDTQLTSEFFRLLQWQMIKFTCNFSFLANNSSPSAGIPCLSKYFMQRISRSSIANYNDKINIKFKDLILQPSKQSTNQNVSRKLTNVQKFRHLKAQSLGQNKILTNNIREYRRQELKKQNR